MSTSCLTKIKILAVLAGVVLASLAATCNTNNGTPDINSIGGGQKLNDPAPSPNVDTPAGVCGTLSITGDASLVNGTTHTFSSNIQGTCDNPIHTWSIASGDCSISGSATGASID